MLGKEPGGRLPFFIAELRRCGACADRWVDAGVPRCPWCVQAGRHIDRPAPPTGEETE